jgi:uncharacterized delta-60 repeat protein
MGKWEFTVGGGIVRSFFYLVWFAAAASCAGLAVAADGAFDATFASGGRRVYTLFGTDANITRRAQQTADGRILILGGGTSTALARLGADGNFDQTYGQGGVGAADFATFTGLPSGQILANDLALLPDGRAAVAGNVANSSGDGIFLVRADGTGLDTSVGNGTGYFIGIQSAPLQATYLKQQSDGKYVVGGTGYKSGYGEVFQVSRILADLSGLDLSFGSNGVAQIAFGLKDTTSSSEDDEIAAIAIQPDGKIVVAGYENPENYVYHAEIARLLPNGTIDTAFGGNGNGLIAFNDSATTSAIYALAIDPGARIVFAGLFEDDAVAYEMVGRLTGSGATDLSFNGGLYEYTYQAEDLGVKSLAVTGDSILAGSEIRGSSDASTYFQVARINFSGRPVVSFGNNGTSFSNFAADSTDTDVSSIFVTNRGIVIAGTSSAIGKSDEMGIARLQYEHIFDASFE